MVTRYLGIGREDSGYSERSALSPVILDMVESNLQGRNDDVELTRGLTTRQRAESTATDYVVEGEVVLPVFNDFPLLLYGLMGSIKSEEIGSTGFYEHTITEGWGAPSFTLFEGKEEFEKVFLGCVANELTLQDNNNFLEATLGFNGSHDREDSLRDVDELDFPAEVYSTLNGQLLRDGVDITPRIKAFQLTIQSNFDTEEKIPFNKRWPDKIPRPQELRFNLQSTIEFQGKGELQRFWGSTSASEPQQTKLEESLTLKFQPVPGEREFIVDLPRNIMVSHAAPIDANQTIEETFTYEGLFDRSSWSGLQLKMINGHDGSKYK